MEDDNVDGYVIKTLTRKYLKDVFFFLNTFFFYFWIERECPFYLRDNLAKAIRSKDPQALNDAIKKCEEAEYPELGSDVRRARDVLESLGGGRGG